MKKINIIDLDNTLVPYDTFRKLLKHYLTKNLTSLCYLSVISVFRILRIWDATKFFTAALGYCQRQADYSSFVRQHAETIISDIDKNVLSTVNKNSDAETENIICSASPKDYVVLVANKLGWQSVGSSLDKHLNNGEKKLKVIEQLYAKDTYVYNFAISDSLKDLGLLKRFNSYLIYTRNGEQEQNN